MDKIFEKLIFFFLLSLYTLAASANELYYHSVYQQNLSQLHGLVSNEVNCILQDSKGFMWFGTNNGLCRFDGYEFKVYKSNYLNPQLLTDNLIRCMAEDKNKRLWIGTKKGVNMLELRTGKLISFDHDISKLDISAIAVSADNVVYFGTSDGLYCFNEDTHYFDKIELNKHSENVNWNYIKTIFIDSKNYMWIGGWESGYLVYNLNTNQFVDYPYLKDKEKLIVNYIYEDSDHHVWFSTWDKYGVWRIENPHRPSHSKLTKFAVPKNKKSMYYPVVYAIQEDPDRGHIFLATSDGIQIIEQTNRHDRDSVVDISNSIKVSSEEIYTLYTDRSNLIWYSTYGIGVNALKMREINFDQFNLSGILAEEHLQSSVTAIYQDETGLLWLGLNSFVLGLFDPENNKFQLYNENLELKKISSEANSIYTFYKPPMKNELWLGTRYDGLYIVKFNGNEIISVEKKVITGVDPKNLSIRSIIKNSQTQDIWIGTNRGLICATYQQSENKYVFRYNHQDIVNSKLNINTLLADAEENLWIGTNNNGLFKYSVQGDNIKNMERYSFDNGKLNNNDVLCSFQDHQKRIWIGTKGGGLSLYDKEKDKFNIIDSMPLIPDDAIFSINEDNWGNLWLGTGNGLICYNEDLPYGEKIKIYTEDEGVFINTFNLNSSFQNDKNELFYGGKNGFVTFIPEKRERVLFAPSPVITGIAIANRPIEDFPLDEREKMIQSEIPYENQLTLSHLQNNIRIEFSSLLYNNNMAVKYAYQLEGADKNWVYVSSKSHSVNYNNLSRGEYIFKVKATNEEGIWCDSPTILHIKMKPAPWQTAYAYILYFIFFGFVSLSVFRYFSNQLKLKRIIAEEEIEREKSEEIYQTKLNIFTNISHEFFTPITIIKCAIENLKNKYHEDVRYLQTMKVNADRLVRLLEQIIEFRKIETEHIKMKLTEVEFVSFTRELCDVHFVSMAAEKNVSLFFNCSHERIEGYVDSDKLDMIIYNLLSNAIKYNKEGGSVFVTVDVVESEDTKQLLLKVEDTGYGMSKEEQKHIFDRFYHGNFRDIKVKSIGIGLSLTNDLVKLHNGNITVESEKGAGSVFLVTIPISEYNVDSDVIIASEDVNYHVTEDNKIEGVTESNKLRILLVEDNKELLELMAEALKQDFVVLKSKNGKEALQTLGKRVVDVMVTDILMPEMDGLELVSRMKMDVQFSHIPVLMLSARHNIEHKIQGYDAGADSYITKPFEMSVLIANIKSLVNNRKLQAESFSSIQGFYDVSEYTYNDVDKEFLENVIKAIEENVLEKDFTTADLYEIFNMSQPTFYRKLQALIGISPNELIKKVKINIARQMLVHRKLSVSEVAYELGFSDPKYFSTVFKKEVGINPGEYVKNHRIR